MEEEISLLANIGPFSTYFCLSLVAVVIFKVLYSALTPHKEYVLIKEQRNEAAGLAYGGAILGFCIALAGAASNSVGITDYIFWAVVALVGQLVAFAVTLIFMPLLSDRIEANEVSAAYVLASLSIGIGFLNAACMSY